MDAYADFFPDLCVAAALLAAALATAPRLERLRLPGPAAFLFIGIAAGRLGIGPATQLSVQTLERIGAVALFLVLFQGGIHTGLRAARAAARPIVLLAIVGTAVTALLLTLVGRYVLAAEWSVAVLVAVALAPTDPAAVYALVRGRSGSPRARTILEGESGFNDPAAIALMVAVTAITAGAGTQYVHAVFGFVRELAIGSLAGLIGGLILLLAIRNAPKQQSSTSTASLVVAAVVLLGAVTATLHGSGFLAVYLAGLILSDSWAAEARTGRAVPEALSAAAEPLLFVMLGAALAPDIGRGDILRGLALTIVTILVVRPLVTMLCLSGSGIHGRDRALVSWGGLKGAVPLLLAGYPALERFHDAEAVAATVLVATAASLTIQGVTLPYAAARLQRSAQRERSMPVVPWGRFAWALATSIAVLGGSATVGVAAALVTDACVGVATAVAVSVLGNIALSHLAFPRMTWRAHLILASLGPFTAPFLAWQREDSRRRPPPLRICPMCLRRSPLDQQNCADCGTPLQVTDIPDKRPDESSPR